MQRCLDVTFVALLPLTECRDAVNEVIFGAAVAADAGAETATVRMNAASVSAVRKSDAVRMRASLRGSKAGLTLAINAALCW